MKQIFHAGGDPASAYRLQRQEESDEGFDAPDKKKYDFAKARRKHFVNDPFLPAIIQSIDIGLHESDVDILLREMQAEVVPRNRPEEPRTISTHLLAIQENERRRIAADLHDGIGQSLSIIRLTLDSAMQQIRIGEVPQALEALQQVSGKVKETMGELHRTAMDMRPSMLDDLGIIPTLSWFFREFESAWQGRKLEKNVSIAESDVPAPLRVTIFRVLQEAMNNVVKHAGADCIRVSLNRSGGLLQLSVEDNGRGFDPDAVTLSCGARCCDTGCGFGLLTMKERARSTNGIFEMRSAVEEGTRILVSWRFMDGAMDR
ncbi:oxygen sensor histidine kinase NreB [mine drainage metagenome]|uniref:histidine kinase n=1 Tax=mine drainage metagenome TaxID=410659 RepID=A0A1J5TEM0_9ZZZZ